MRACPHTLSSWSPDWPWQSAGTCGDQWAAAAAVVAAAVARVLLDAAVVVVS